MPSTNTTVTRHDRLVSCASDAAQRLESGHGPCGAQARRLDVYRRRDGGVIWHGERGSCCQRSSEDLDILVNIRLMTHGTEEFSRLLLEIGMDLDGSSPAGLAHRFVGRGTKVDILAAHG